MSQHAESAQAVPVAPGLPQCLLAAVVMALASCASTRDLGPSLHAAVGKLPSEVTYPPMNRLTKVTEASGTRTQHHELSGAGNCRWEFDVAATTGRIVAWRYPDASAERYCSSLASTRP
jgi:hypothetical protein